MRPTKSADEIDPAICTNVEWIDDPLADSHASHDGQRKIEPREHRKRHEPDKAHAESDGYKRPHPRLPEHPAADKAQTRIAQRRRSQQATSDERRETRHPFQIKRNEQTEVN